MTTCRRILTADVLTPVSAYALATAAHPGRPAFLFESVLPAQRWGRYSIVGFAPQHDHVFPLTREGWEALSSAVESLPVDTDFVDGFVHGLVGAISYETVEINNPIKSWPASAEPSAAAAAAAVAAKANTKAPPLARMMQGCSVYLFDHFDQTLTVAAPDGHQLEAALALLDKASTQSILRPLEFQKHSSALPALRDSADPWENIHLELDDAAFIERITRAKAFVQAGDAFQIVLSRTFSRPRGSASALNNYRWLRARSPSPYLYLLHFPSAAEALAAAEAPAAHDDAVDIIGASPETLVRVQPEGQFTLRPIAGTRRRGQTPADDSRLETELLADPKERAEHVMLIDLARNDAGRVCEVGTVTVPQQMLVERHSHVMHIVSEVTGTLRPEVSAMAAFAAAFPAGTLSGAPKVRAMQIIRELEDSPRGIYGGAVGYFGHRRNFDFAIAIRTIVSDRDGLHVRTGAGVVFDSDPQLEALETRNKARAAVEAMAHAEAACNALATQ